MILSNKQAKKLGINKTLDLKEIMLNAEGYYKIEKSKLWESIPYMIYAFALVLVINLF